MSTEEAAPIVQSSAAMSAQRGPGAPSAGGLSTQQDTMSLDSTEDRVQPFPRSPQLQRKLAKAALPTQEQLSKKMEELQAERVKSEARIQSLKKRGADLTMRTEEMKQQIHACFEAMRSVLKRDEQAVMDTLDMDLKRTRTTLDKVLKTWNQRLDQVLKTMSSVHKAQRDNSATEEEYSGGELEGKKENISLKKPDDLEKTIGLKEERFEKLVNMLSTATKQLKVQMQRKTLLLDLMPVVVQPQICHSHLTVTSGGRGLFYGPARPAPEHPLQFDKVCCALGSAPISSGQAYWEVDVRCCSGWAVGVAYGRMERKGRDKGCKLGRNMNSWCVEFKDKKLSAWHNDRHVPCQGRGQTRLKTVGVWVQFDKGQLVFYDAETMSVLQSFSAAMTPVFDRAHHQFIEPLFPAVRFIEPDARAPANHIEFSHNPLN